MLRGTANSLDKKDLECVSTIADAGRVNLPLQHCLSADEGGLADTFPKSTYIFVECLCSLITFLPAGL